MTSVDRRLTLVVLLGAALATSVAALPAGAHVGQSTNGLWKGATHPLLGVDHVFAMVTVGILAVVLERPFRIPVAFLAAMALGGAVGIAGWGLPAGEIAIACSVVALGGALIAGHALLPGVALGLVCLAGFTHGHAHGVEAPEAAHLAVYIIGFLAATAALHCAGVGIGWGVVRRPQIKAVLGAAVVGVGVGLIAGVI